MIRSIFDYADVLFPYLPDSLSKRLESVQRHAALLCTKAYTRTPHILLLKELGWDELYVRRKYHCLILMYKIQNKLVPSYLYEICPKRRNVQYQLRNVSFIQNFFCKYAAYRKSFFPFTIAQWNSLDQSLKTIDSLLNFKKSLKNRVCNSSNKLFSYHHGRAAINHTRMRLGLSPLNSHRAHYGFIENSCCLKCGFVCEDVGHFFFVCSAYDAHRLTMFTKLTDIIGQCDSLYSYTDLSRNGKNHLVSCFLQGFKNLSIKQNIDVFDIIHCFIKDTKRFI